MVSASQPDDTIIRERLTPQRLTSYETASQGDLASALALYDWNSRVSAALFEVIGHLEIAVRNAMAAQLLDLQRGRGWRRPWYRTGRKVFGDRDIEDLDRAINRATRAGVPEQHGKVVAELNFGFWRFLTSRRHHTALWVPALHAAFPHLPNGGPHQDSRERVFKRMTDVNVVRNRIAHHEPIHRRDLVEDERRILEILNWLCPHMAAWVRVRSRVHDVLQQRPI